MAFFRYPGAPRREESYEGSLVTLLVKLTFAPKMELSCESCALLGFPDFLFHWRKIFSYGNLRLGGTLRQIP